MLWVVVALAVGELLVVHLFLSLSWPALAWPLFALTAASILWMVAWIRSLKSHPHLLDGEELRLRIGSLRSVPVPVSSIERVSASWAPGEHGGAGALNTVPLAYPNRLLRLKAPLRIRKAQYDRIALRIDDAPTFDAAMASRGIPVR